MGANDEQHQSQTYLALYLDKVERESTMSSPYVAQEIKWDSSNVGETWGKTLRGKYPVILVSVEYITRGFWVIPCLSTEVCS